MGQRGIYVEGLLGDPTLLLLPQGVNGPEVVETVEQLDDQDPDVLGHGHHHLADGRRLGLLPVRVADPVELGHPIDETPDLVAELHGEVAQREVRVLHGVMEQGGGQGLLVEPVAGQHVGNGQRMGDVWVTRLSHLAGMSLCRHLVGPAQQVDIAIGMMGDENLGDVLECRLTRLSRT